MKKQLRDEWVKALRSGEYEQHRYSLHNSSRTAFCCLGVLCEVAGERDLTATSLDFFQRDPHRAAAYTLVEMNDRERKDFPAIADWIEANVPVEE